MADLTALMTSKNEHYCTPPSIVRPMRRVLVPKGSGRRLLDPATNDASIVGADLIADGVKADGLTLAWSVADCWFNNPPYGNGVTDKWTSKQSYWGGTVGVPGIALLPGRTDTEWAREVFSTADAWVFIDGRLTFLIPIPLTRDEAPDRKDKNGKPIERYFLRRWFKDAAPDNLPPGFSLLKSGLIVGPELGENGRPQSAPFPSMVAFWADQDAYEVDTMDEIKALRELVRCAREPVAFAMDSSRDLADEVDDGKWSADAKQRETWLAEAEALLGSKRFANELPMQLEVFERLGMAGKTDPHPIDMRTFAKHFLPLGTLVVARGRHRGVWRLPS